MIEKYKHINVNPWQFNDSYPAGKEFDVKLSDGSILCECLLQSDGDIWWGGAGVGERFFDPAYTTILGWRLSV